MALGVRARVGVGVGAVLGLSAAVAVVWFAASTATSPSMVRYVNGSAPATAPPPPPENPHPGICEPTISFCHYHRIPYNFTIFPNFMGHFTPHDAQQELEQYDVVLQTNCYELAALYLCTVFAPKCGNYGSIVRPCRSLCLETQRRCGAFLDKFDLTLPVYLECDLFPDSPDADVCVGHREVQQAELRARKPEAAASSECVSGHRKANLKAGCGGSCYCLGGQWVCPEGDCGDGAGEEQEGERDAEAAPEPFSLPLRRSKRVPLDGERCAPGVTYMDECNTCICSMDGIKAHASCTFKVCPK